MEYIAHRVNTLMELRALNRDYGVELDLRDSLDGNIYIQHNPFEPGEDFESYLKEYHHGTMILNVKSERIEYKILDMLEKYKIKQYFFLDSTFPMIYTLAKQGEKNVAIRLSEYEGMDTVRNMAGLISWVWVDCFTRIPVTKEDLGVLHDWGYQVCFVSPELEGRPEDLEKYKSIVLESGLEFDAICTKSYNISKWKN